MVLKVKDIKGSWIFILPVFGVVIGNAMNHEIKIDRVTFISVKKFRRVRKRFAVRSRLSDLKPKHIFQEFFDSCETLAVVRCAGTIQEKEASIVRLVQEELDLLSVSRLGYSKRRFTGVLSIQRSGIPSINYLVLNSKNDSWSMSDKTTGKYGPLSLDIKWKKWSKDYYYSIFLKIVEKEVMIDSSWLKTLRRAGGLIGQSQNSNDLANAFMLNMIAIEMLLTSQGDKYSTVLPQRIEAFVGWVGFWGTKNYETRIGHVYKKRCKYVHDGNSANISVEDLLFTDDIALNILMNLIMHHKIFQSKNDVIKFASKVQAEHLLGIVGRTSKIRPKTLSYMSRKYSDEDLSRI